MIHADGILDRVSGLADELKLATLQPQITACRELLQRRNGIDVAVFGRFKAGKSSFLNHLTGRAVLPIGVVPLTAVITRLRYGEHERAQVRFLDGTDKAISLDDIRLYVGEDENPNNVKQVAAAEVALPELKALAPLQFVDTPGLGSALTHNAEATRDWLPNVGAAVVAISSDAPLSERDLELLEELRRHTPKIVLLLTKADLLTGSQRAEVLDFVRQQLLRKWQTELPVFFYSIRSEEGDLKTELEQKLLSPLVQNWDAAADQIARHKLLSLVAQTRNYLRIALAVATQSESSRHALREKLAEERRQFDLLKSELSVLSHEWSANALDWYLARLHPTQLVLQEQITRELRKQFPSWKLRLPPLLDAWRAWLNEFLTRELNEVSRQEQQMFCEPLRKAQSHLTRTLRAFHDRLAKHVKSALGVTLAPHEFALEVREPTSPPVHVAYAFDVAFATIGWLIPLALFRKLIERQLFRKARYEVAKNMSRLSADWHSRIAKIIDELTHDAERQAMGELAALEQALAQTVSKAHGLSSAVGELEQFESRLRSDASSSVTVAGAVPATATST